MATEGVDIDGLLGTVLVELGRRLAERPDEVPAHVLARMFDQAVRLKKEEEEPETEEEKRGLLDWIEDAGLPQERKQELLKEEILRLEEQMGRAYEILRELEDKDLRQYVGKVTDLMEDDDRTGEAIPPSEPRSFHR